MVIILYKGEQLNNLVGLQSHHSIAHARSFNGSEMATGIPRRGTDLFIGGSIQVSEVATRLRLGLGYLQSRVGVFGRGGLEYLVEGLVDLA